MGCHGQWLGANRDHPEKVIQFLRKKKGAEKIRAFFIFLKEE